GRLPGDGAAGLPGQGDPAAGRPAGRPAPADGPLGHRHVRVPQPQGGDAVRIVRAWNTFWFAPTSARPLGAFRAVFGLIALLNLALLSLERDYWLTDAGLLVGSEAREAAGAMSLGGWTFVSRPSLLHYVQDPASVRVFYYAMYAVTALFTLGWHTRL